MGKRSILISLLISLIFLLFPLSLFAKPLDKTYKVVVVKNWKPYYFIDKNGMPNGYGVKLFEKLALNINLKYEYVVVDNWKEAFGLIEKKEAHIIPNVGITLKRADYMDFTQTTDVFEIGLYKNKKLTNLNSLEDIDNNTVGVVLKNVCTKLITQDITENKILFNGYYRALAAVNENEIDILCYPKPLIMQSVKELNLQNIEPFGEPLKVVKRAIGVSKAEKHLLDLLDKELLRIKGTGEYQKIYDSWFKEHKDIEIDFEQLLFIILVFIIIILIILYIMRNKNLILTKKELDNKIKEVEELKNEQLKQQKIILTQSKVAAVGEMLGNIAHQWRQPLSIITTNVSALQAEIEFGNKLSNEKVSSCADGVLKQADYLSKTIDDFREFFKEDSKILKKHNLKDVMKRLEELVEGSFKNNFIKCVVDIGEDIILNINDNTLIQSLINICNNSKDAMVEKESDSRYFFVEVKKSGKDAVIIFKDSGGGIDDKVIDKIFDPYFTTKHQSVGTGIGLYMTHQIITKHLKGSIEVSNTEYEYEGKKLKGARFRITIPVDQNS